MSLLAILLVALLAPLSATSGDPDTAVRPPIYGYEVVRAYPHDPNAFTQGLAYLDGVLIESTGRYPSTVRRVRLEDGAVLRRQTLDSAYFGEGLAVFGERVLTLTWRNGRGFVWDAADLSSEGQFSYAGEGWGLTADATRLILSDGTSTLRFLDPRTFAETGRVTVTFGGRPLDDLNELEWIEGEVFANVWQTDQIVRIDPATGVVTGVIDLTGLLPDRLELDSTDDVLNGIAWDADGRRLFVTGKNWPALFEIHLTAQSGSQE